MCIGCASSISFSHRTALANLESHRPCLTLRFESMRTPFHNMTVEGLARRGRCSHALADTSESDVDFLMGTAGLNATRSANGEDFMPWLVVLVCKMADDGVALWYSLLSISLHAQRKYPALVASVGSCT